jgi:hypothetical protein
MESEVSTASLQVVWQPSDWHETREQAAAQCPAALSMYGIQFECDNTQPGHATHTSADLRARWVDSAVSR